jgi:hypothetical protein
MSKYVDLIVVVWRQRRDWYLATYVRLQNFPGHYKRTKLVYSSDVLYHETRFYVSLPCVG